MEDSVYFVTFDVKHSVLNIDEQIIVKEHIIESNNKYYLLYAVIVMPDHVHVIFKPTQNYILKRIMGGIKGVSAYKVNKLRGTKGQLWQDESFDRIVRDLDELNEKLIYMFNNPIKAGFTKDT